MQNMNIALLLCMKRPPSQKRTLQHGTVLRVSGSNMEDFNKLQNTVVNWLKELISIEENVTR